MGEITFLAQVQSNRQPKMGLAILLFVLLVFAAFIIFISVNEKRGTTVYLLLALPLLLAGIKNNASVRQQIQSLATLSVNSDDNVLELRLANARLYHDEYVDGIYTMGVSSIEYIEVLDEKLTISAVALVERAEKNGITLMSENLDYGTLTLRISPDDGGEIRDFLRENVPDVMLR